MNLYSLRKFIYALGGVVLGEVLMAVGSYLVNTPTDSLLLRQVMYIAGTVAVATARRKLLPGLFGSQN